MSQTWTATVVASDLGSTVLPEVLSRTLTLGTSFSGTSLPVDADLAAGRVALHLDAGGAGFDQLKLYSDPDNGGDGWHGIAEFVPTNITYANATANTTGQLVGFGFERTSSDPTPAAGNVGQLIHHTGLGKLKVIETASKIGVVVSGSNVDHIPGKELPLESWTLGSTPPTATTIGTTPTVPGLLMDATAETLSRTVRVPAGYSGDADLTLRLFFALPNAETAGDDIDVTVDLVAAQPGAAEALTKTSTQATVSHDIGAIVDQYSTHVVDVTLDYDDATNPIAAGDMLALEFHLTNLTTVAAVVFLGGELLTPFGSTIFESVA